MVARQPDTPSTCILSYWRFRRCDLLRDGEIKFIPPTSVVQSEISLEAVL